MDFHGLKARVTVEIQDATGKPVAVVGVAAKVGANDPADVLANVERLGSQACYAVGPKLADAASGRLIVPDIADVERRKAIGDYLRKLADELKGKALYFPDKSLRFYADEIDPSDEQLKRGIAAHTDWPNQMTPEHCRSVEGATMTAQKSEATHVVILNGGVYVIYPITTRPKIPESFRGTEEACREFKRACENAS